MKKRVIIIAALSGLLLLNACAPASFQREVLRSKSTLALLPSWYHEEVGYQLAGGNHYPGNQALANLLRQADGAFMQADLARCQILLERAQRIASRDASVYVRLSYVYWVLHKTAQAEQMALRALALVAADAQAKLEVARLLAAIEAGHY
ncbi:MAG: hypothetical protein RPR40_00095 [Bermanella sp.]